MGNAKRRRRRRRQNHGWLGIGIRWIQGHKAGLLRPCAYKSKLTALPERKLPMKERGITIQDVARASNVSPTTISNFLNGRHKEMRAETFDRISKTIEQLGYTPNRAARQLKTGQSSTLGLLLPTVVNPYFAELVVAIDSVAQENGFHVILCNTQRHAQREIDMVLELLASGVKGILASSVLQNTKTMKTLIKRGVAFVLFEAQTRTSSMDQVDIVSMDNEATTRKAVDYLASLGHRSIAYVTATPLTPHRQLRMDGYTAAMRDHSLDTPYILKDEDIAASFSPHNDRYLAQFGQKAACHLIKQTPRPTAVITLNDQVALGMMFSFIEHGLKIPEDISIIGIDDTQLSSFVYPTLTSVRQPYQQIAQTAVELVRKRLVDPERIGSTVLLEPTLICRGSTARIDRIIPNRGMI